MRRTAAVVSASALLALTACGADEPGDDGEASPSPSSSPSTSSAAPAPTTDTPASTPRVPEATGDVTTGLDAPWDVAFMPDGAAVVLPANGKAPALSSMGSAQSPVNEWFWRADLAQPEHLVAHGLGTDKPSADVEVKGGASWNDGRWSVVLSRQLKAKGAESAKLTPGKATSVAFSVWEGSNQERGDLHSYSREWRELTLES